MYDSHGWNMVPMYPVSPVQRVHDASDGHSRQHPRKPWANYTQPNSPTSDSNQRAVCIQSLSPATTAADLKELLQSAGTVEHCNVAVVETLDNRSQIPPQPHGSAIMRSAEEARRAVTMFNNIPFMGAPIRVHMDHGSGLSRSGSWDSAMTASEDLSVPDLEFSHHNTEIGKDEQESQSIKTVDPHKPLVVDGSGMQKRSLELLSTSAPT